MAQTSDIKLTNGDRSHFKWVSELMVLADSQNKARLLLVALILPVLLVFAAGVFFMSQTDVVQTQVDAAEELPPPLDFKTAREFSSNESMRSAVEQMWINGEIKKGMTVRAVMDVLGVPDNTTGIYLKKGYSIGYSSLKPTKKNYNEFFWLHFRKDTAFNSTEEVLVGWWDVTAKGK